MERNTVIDIPSPTMKVEQLRTELYGLMERRGDPYDGARIIAGRNQQGGGKKPLMKSLRSRLIHVLNVAYLIANATNLDPAQTTYGEIHDWYVSLPLVPHSAERFLQTVIGQDERGILSDIIENRGVWRNMPVEGKTIQEYIERHAKRKEIVDLVKNPQNPRTRFCDRCDNLEAALGDFLCYISRPEESPDKYLPLEVRQRILYGARETGRGELNLPESLNKEQERIKEWLNFRVKYEDPSQALRESAGVIMMKRVIEKLNEVGEDKLPYFKKLPFSPHTIYTMTDAEFKAYIRAFAERFDDKLSRQLLEVMSIRSVPGINRRLSPLKYGLNFKGGKSSGVDSTGSGPNKDACKAVKTFLNSSTREKVSEAEHALFEQTHHPWTIVPMIVEGPQLGEISVGEESLGNPMTQPEVFSGFGYQYPTQMSGYISKKKSEELFTRTMKSVSPEISIWLNLIKNVV